MGDCLWRQKHRELLLLRSLEVQIGHEIRKPLGLTTVIYVVESADEDSVLIIVMPTVPLLSGRHQKATIGTGANPLTVVTSGKRRCSANRCRRLDDHHIIILIGDRFILSQNYIEKRHQPRAQPQMRQEKEKAITMTRQSATKDLNFFIIKFLSSNSHSLYQRRKPRYQIICKQQYQKFN